MWGAIEESSYCFCRVQAFRLKVMICLPGSVLLDCKSEWSDTEGTWKWFNGRIYLEDFCKKQCYLLYSLVWLTPRRLHCLYRRFGTSCPIFINCLNDQWRWNKQCVSKRQNIKFRHRGITQKRKYNSHTTAGVW
jgi:hypothetical protein